MICSINFNKKEINLFIAIVLLIFIMSACNKTENEQSRYTFIVTNSGICFLYLMDSSDVSYYKGIELLKKGNYNEAEKVLKDDLEQKKRSSQSDHMKEGIVLNALGVCDIALYKNDSAVERLRMANELISLENGKGSSDAAIVSNNLGIVLMTLEKFDESSNLLKQAKKYDNSMTKLEKSCLNINNAFQLIYQGKNEEGIKIFYSELNKIDDNSMDEKLLHAFLKSNIAIFDYDTLGLETAIKYCDEAIEVYKKIFDESNAELAHMYICQGSFNKKLQNYDKAGELLKKAIGMQENSSNYNPLIIAQGYSNLGAVQEELNNCDDAIKYFEKAYNIFIEYEELYFYAGNSYNAIALCYYEKEEYDIATKYFLKGYWILEESECDPALLQMFRDNLKNMYGLLELDSIDFNEWLEQQRDVEIVLPKVS